MSKNRYNLDIFIKLIESGNCFPGIKIEARCPGHFNIPFTGKNTHHLHKKDILRLSKAMVSGKCSDNIEIDLSWNTIKDKGVFLIADLLKHPNCPSNLKLNLTGNLLTDKGAIALLNAVNDGHNTSGIAINLSGKYARNSVPFFHYHFFNRITDETAIHLSNLIRKQQFPQNVTLDFSCTHITNLGISYVVKALEEAKVNNYPSKNLNLILGQDIDKVLKEDLNLVCRDQASAGNLAQLCQP